MRKRESVRPREWEKTVKGENEGGIALRSSEHKPEYAQNTRLTPQTHNSAKSD